MKTEDYIKLEDRMPTEKDMPFVTYGEKLSRWPDVNSFIERHEIWDDTDWFFELTDADRDEWIWWAPMNFPKTRKDG
jgi:hypothetical protein